MREPEPEPVAGDLSAMSTCTIGVRVRGHFREPTVYEWQESEEQEYDQDIIQRWIGRGSFSGDMFSATWERAAHTIPGEANDSKGSLSVRIDPTTKRVLSFTATKTETSPAGTEPVSVTTASISGGEIPFAYHLEVP